MNIITHRTDKFDEKHELFEVKERLLKIENDAEREKQLQIYDQLCQFEFGRWLLINRGLNAYWSYYLNYFEEFYGFDIENKLQGLEKIMLLQSPGVVAAKEKTKITNDLLQKLLEDNMVIASIPCGLMNDLFRLDLSNFNGVKLVGIDADIDAINRAKENAIKLNKQAISSFINQDAWKLNIHNEFDLLNSHGLNMYVKEESKLIELYRIFYNSLKSGGYLIISSNTPPNDENGNVFWKMNLIDMNQVKLQKLIYNDVIQVRQGLYPNENEIVKQLKSVGFISVHIIHDSRKMFPIFQACK